MKRDKNIVDNFLDNYGKNKVIYKRVYEKPSKVTCVIYFIFSLIFMIILIRFFSFTSLFFILFLGNLLILGFYGINLFTKKGIAVPKTIKIDENIDIIDKYNVKR